MKTKNTEKSNTVAIILFLIGCMGIVSVIVLDKLYWGTGVFAEGWPNFSFGHLIRNTIIFISLLAISGSLIGSNRPKLILDESNGVPLGRLSILGVLSVSGIFLFLFILEPSIFSVLSLEDGLIEWGSALLLFGSCIIVAISFSKSRNVANISKFTQLSIVILSLVFFVMAMEEVSWFQRVLGIETPKLFDGNIQHEMNLHNFATNYVENIYYFGSFLFLVVLPFLRLLFPYVSNNNYLSIFVARPFIGVIGSIACSYNFDMWNIIFTQIAFWGSVLILFAFAIFSSKRKERYIIIFTIFIISITQTLFLLNGVNFARLWEVTEYKEFLISLAFFIYSLDVFTYINWGCLPAKR